MKSKFFALAAALLCLAPPVCAVPPVSAPAAPTIFPTIRPHTLVCIGDSIPAQICGGLTGSPMFESLTTQPRDINIINYAVSGSTSGAYPGHTAVDGTDLNTPIIIAKTIAAAPDDVFIGTGGNDTGGTFANNYANVKAVVLAVMQALPNVHFVLFTSPPQARGVGDASRLFMMRSQYFALHAAYPNNIMMMELENYAVDDQTMHCPIGWNAGTAANCTGEANTAIAGTNPDGQHPSNWLARNAAADFTTLADTLRWPRIPVTIISRYDRYNSSTLPGGSLYGGLSVMYGSASGGIGANMTGTTPQDDVSTSTTWSQSTTSSELTGVASTGGTLSYSGNTFRSAHIVLTATTTLTADRTYTFSRTGGIAVTPGGPMRCSVLVNLAASPVGVQNVVFLVSGTVGGVAGTAYSWGSKSATGAQNDIQGRLYQYVLPNYMVFDAGTNVAAQVAVTIRTGTAAGTVATLDIAQLVCTPVVAP